jgi:catechol 2,3-dioxygenase-like lactoylglutathione lyase family enzyme
MLEHFDVVATIPAQDLERAKSFYADKLGLKPFEESPEGVYYRCGDGRFLLFQSSGRASGDHTQMGWYVDDIEAAVTELQARGVVFEEYDFPELKTLNGVAEIEGEKAAWFKDTEGNLLSLGQTVR